MECWSSPTEQVLLHHYILAIYHLFRRLVLEYLISKRDTSLAWRRHGERYSVMDRKMTPSWPPILRLIAPSCCSRSQRQAKWWHAFSVPPNNPLSALAAVGAKSFRLSPPAGRPCV